ncbi:MAG TPA: ATP-binding protein [Sandaracinaceae bacterium LLY-WYZ-13_1]|nr:ATP-binding protein [Sandaracinaceae bacterium LLY-WYZ-13_1]
MRARSIPLRDTAEASSVSLDPWLTHLRARAFVGRRRELAWLEGLLENAPPAEPMAAYLFGPGGGGKSTLLQRFVDTARRRGHAVVQLDLSSVPVKEALARRAVRDAAAQLRSEPGVGLLVLDRFEAHAALEAAYRERLFAALPATVRLVFAGRIRLSEPWRTDPGWSRLLECRALAPLPRTDAIALLRSRGLEARRAASLADAAAGHPDALVRMAAHGAGERGPIGRAALLEGLDAPARGGRRDALLALALLGELDLPLLQAMLPSADPDALAAWLARVSWVRPRPGAWAMEPAYRAPVLADLRDREPHTLRALYLRAVDLLEARMRAAPEVAGRTRWGRALLEPMSVLPLPGRQFVSDAGFAAASELVVGSVMPEDEALLDAAVRHHEGPGAARIAAAERARDPERVRVFRDARGGPRAFVQWRELEGARPLADEADPGAARIAAGLPPGSRALVFRTWMDLDRHQAPSAGVAAASAWIASRGLARRDIDFHLVVASDWALGDEWVEAGALERFESLDFIVQETTYAVRGLDLRCVDGAERLAAAARHLLEPSPRAGTPPGSAPEPTRSLDAALVERGVRHGLRWFGDDARLGSNPLVEAPNAGPAGPDALRTLLREEVERLGLGDAHPTPAALLTRSYLEPAGKQLAVAAELGLPYGTYRRRLRAAVRALVARVQTRLGPPTT